MNTSNTKITDKFWLYYRNLVRKEMIPYQWNVLNDNAGINVERERNDMSLPAEKSHAIENLKIAAGRSKGHHFGWVFQDSDVYKWLEAAAFSLMEKPDPDLKSIADGVVELIAEAQEDDGYLSTYFTIEAPDRKFKVLRESHELYCAGHFMEAAAAYYQATGSRLVMETAEKLADHLDSCFGPEDGKIHGADGHEEVEIGLMKLYHLTGNERYMKLAAYFLDVRGRDPEFFAKQKAADPGKDPVIGGMDRFQPSYFQWHKPVTEQDSAEGHAVRLVYMCTAMADLAAASGNSKMYEACRRIWRNIVDKRMYITGGIGSTVQGEAFTFDYDLPNDTMYCETCASIGLIFFAERMLRNEALGEYADIMERALYNTALAGMALDGKHFFYVNPLEVEPEACAKDPGKGHVKPVRPSWYGCACCPPNLARLLASLDRYAFTQIEDDIYINLYMSCESEFRNGHGRLKITETTNYPWNGKISLKADSFGTEGMKLGIRIPGWAGDYSLKVGGKQILTTPVNGYIMLEGVFKNEHIELEFDMPVTRCYANPKVKADVGKTAIMRGPLVYCLEGADNGTGLQSLYISHKDSLTAEPEVGDLGKIVVIRGKGYDIQSEPRNGESLYVSESDRDAAVCERPLKWIPYYAWANRGENEMTVWVNER